MPATEPQSDRQNKMEAWPSMEREVVITRIFDAPRELVFKAWTDPEMMKRWFGPKVFTNPVCEIDLRTGGAYRIVMRGPDGKDYPCAGVYKEIDPPSRLAFTNNAYDLDGKQLLDGFTTVTFTEEAGNANSLKTRMVLETRAKGLVPQAPYMLAGMELGWSGSFDKLDVVLKSGSTEENADSIEAREIVITREIGFPRDVVFSAFTDPKHIGRWWGPKGFTTTTAQMDVRPGGVWRFVMHGPDGTNYPNKNVYDEVKPPERLAYTHSGDTDAADDPYAFKVVVTFDDLGGKTLLTMRSLFPTAAARNFVIEKHHAIEGGNQTIDRFVNLLKELIKGELA